MTVRWKNPRRDCWSGCGGQLAWLFMERSRLNERSPIQGKVRCLTCGVEGIVRPDQCELASSIEDPPLLELSDKAAVFAKAREALDQGNGGHPVVAEAHRIASEEFKTLPIEEKRKRLDEASKSSTGTAVPEETSPPPTLILVEQEVAYEASASAASSLPPKEAGQALDRSQENELSGDSSSARESAGIPSGKLWRVTNKGDAIVRALADDHYTRQSKGATMFTRPGYSLVLVCKCSRSGWVWWRPKWEAGLPGTERKDGLRTIECTLFRRESDCQCGRASDLILSAEAMLSSPEARRELHYATMEPLDSEMPVVTAIGVSQTAGRRSARALPGAAYRAAGWVDVNSAKRPPLKGKVWLTKPNVHGAPDEALARDGDAVSGDDDGRSVAVASERGSESVASIAIEPQGVTEAGMGSERVTSHAQLWQPGPLKRFAGNKTALLPRIMPLIPKSFSTYYEPFLGSGAVAFALLGERRDGVRHFDRAVLSDSNERLIRCYRGIRNDVATVIAGCHETAALHRADPEGVFSNARALDVDSRDDATVAVWFLYLNAVGWNGVWRTNKAGAFNVPLGRKAKKPGKDKGTPLLFDFDERRLRQASELLQESAGVELREWNALAYDDSVMAWADAKAGDVVVLDPPYAALSATAEFGSKAGGYGSADGFSEEDQAILAEWAGKTQFRGATVIAHNADVPRVRAWYEAWPGFTVETVSRSGSINSDKDKRGAVAEILAYANVWDPSTAERAMQPSPFDGEDGQRLIVDIPRTPVEKEKPVEKTAKTKKPRKNAENGHAGLFLTKIVTNAKSDSMTPRSLTIDGPKVLIVGRNASHKSTWLHAIELSLTSRATDVVMRDPKLPAELLALAPPGAGMLVAETHWSNGGVASFRMPIQVIKGERKAGRPEQTWNGPGACPVLPIRALEEAITGSADKARAFFLGAVESTVTDADVLALLPSVYHQGWTKDWGHVLNGPDSTVPGRVLMLIEGARSRQRELKASRKTSEALVQQLGERLAAGLPSAEAEHELATSLEQLSAQIRQVEDSGRFAQIVQARAQLAHWRGVLAGLPAVEPRSEANRQVLAALALVLRTAHEKDAAYCPLCEVAVLPGQGGTFDQAAQRVTAFMADHVRLNQQSAEIEQARQVAEAHIRQLLPYAAEGTDLGLAVVASDAATMENQLRALRSAKAETEKNLGEIRLLRSRWDDVARARDQIVAADQQVDHWARVEEALCSVRDALVKRAVDAFAERVNSYLPEGDRFGLLLNDSTGREVFQLGLWRASGDSMAFHAALSGAEETRVLCAVAAALGAGATSGPVVILPRERAHDVETLSEVLKALASAPGTIVLTTVAAPGTRATKGWCVVDVDQAVGVVEVLAPSNGGLGAGLGPLSPQGLGPLALSGQFAGPTEEGEA